jgi:predicted DNA-binding protein
MLGVRLSEETERKLDRHARDIGRSKSAVVREWIEERLERESIDEQMRRAAECLAKHESPERLREAERMSDEFIRMLDEEDGGYDWGDKGPPL